MSRAWSQACATTAWPETVDGLSDGLVRLGGIHGGVGGAVHHDVRIVRCESTPDAVRVGDVDLGYVQTDSSTAEHAEQVSTQLTSRAEDQPSGHEFALSGRHQASWVRYQSMVCASPVGNSTCGAYPSSDEIFEMSTEYRRS